MYNFVENKYQWRKEKHLLSGRQKMFFGGVRGI